MAISTTPNYVLNFNENQQRCDAFERLWMQRESGRFCDIVLHVQGQKLKAHKNVLAACSPYFDTLLKSQNENDELLILCQSLEAFKFLLKFLYTGNVSIDENNVSELLVLASHFLMDNLKNCCSKFLNQYLDLPNCLIVLEMSKEHDLQQLHKRAIEFILNHIDEVFELSEILGIQFDSIKVLLDEIKYFIPQYLLLDFICKWVNHNISERTEHFKILLFTVNWQCVERKFLENHFKTCSLLQSSTKCFQTLVTCLNKNNIKLTQLPNLNDSLISPPNCNNDKEISSLFETSVTMETKSNALDSSDIRADKTNENSGKFDSQRSLKSLSEVAGIFENVLVSNGEENITKTAVSNEIAKDIDTVLDHEIGTVQNKTKVVLPHSSSVITENPLSLNADLHIISSDKSGSDCINNNNGKLSSAFDFCLLPGHLNVLAEVTELFSNGNSNTKECDNSIMNLNPSADNIKLSSELPIATVNLSADNTPSKNVVHRPAIHYLSKTSDKDKSEETDSNKKESFKDVHNNVKVTLYPHESEIKFSDDCNWSSNDSNANSDVLYNSTKTNPFAHVSESGHVLSTHDVEFINSNSKIYDSSIMPNSKSTVQNVVDLQRFIVYSRNKDAQPSNKKDSSGKKINFDARVEETISAVPSATLVGTVDAATEKINRSQRQGWKRNIKCNSCSYVARTPYRLQKHINTIHSKNVSYNCKVCDFTCEWQKEYSLHLKTHFKGPPFSCDLCNYSNNRLPSLLAHRLTHTTQQPFKCDLCERQTRTKAELDYHMRRHTGEKPFQCETCHRAFAIKSCLDQHVLSHGTERTYLCDMCGFSAKYKSHLLNHKRVHRGNVFRCEFEGCSYFTPVRNSFFAHRRIHTNDRPFQCRICGKSFIENSQMKRHERTHMDVRLFFNCDHCEYATTRRDRLKDHVMKYHSEGAKATYRPRKFGRLKKSHSSTKKNFVSSKAVKTVFPSQPDVPAPPIVIAQCNELPGQELVVVTSTLSKEHGPVTFLQVLPSTGNTNVAETKI